jgi:cell division protein ZapA
MEKSLIPLNITVGDRSYRIKTSPDDEEIVRKTLKEINDKIVEFKTKFAGKDMQDYIAMVLIWFATQPQSPRQNIDDEELLEGLEKIKQQLKSLER